MENQVILPLDGEDTNLDLHVKLCALRYNQLLSKFDNVNQRLDKLEEHICDIKDSITNINNNTATTYLKWAGVVIGILSTIVVGLVLHLLK